MNTKIVGVLGLGIFGRTVAEELSRYGHEVIAIDFKSENVNQVANFVTSASVGDFTDIQLLEHVGIQNCDIVVIATGSNLESSVLAIMQCKKLKVPQIVAKARSPIFEEVMYEVGVTTVIAPERDSGFRLATKIMRNHIEEVLRLDDDTSVVEFSIPKEWVGKTLQELDLRRKYDINLVGIRQEKGEPMETLVVGEPLEADILIVAIATSHTFERYDYLNLLK
ncbi:potassium channel family protein [Hutsoniella sourekii]|uniref:potassium channel family protein n=1 Tax=Hutsoniella sourekii TaxID=87650 RepID=UPI000484D7FD|nr:TrkA family potassium uptake protein [Hutsoniella sourekii]